VVSRRTLPVLTLAAFLSVLAGPVRASAQRRLWQRDTRLVVSDDGLILALTAGIRDVYAATPSAVIVRDIVRDTWKPPLPLPPGLVASQPTALAVDPSGGAVWLGTNTGDLYTISPGIDTWDRVTGGAAGPIDAIVPWPREGYVYFRTRAGWRRIATGSLFPEALPATGVPAGVVAAARDRPDDPFFASALGTLGLDPAGHDYRITDIAAGPDPGLYWVGTAGGGIIRYDSRSSRKEWLRFGLASQGAASIARIGDALWFGGDGRGSRGGVARASSDLSDWRQFDSSDGAPRGFVAEIVQAFGAAWFASSDGLFALAADRRDERRPWRRLTSADGLPSDRVRALLFAGGLLWVGTDRGLVAFDSTARVVASMFTGTRVSRMAGSADALLVATDQGLRRIELTGNPAGATPGLASEDPALGGRVTDVLVTNTGTYAVTNGQIRRVGGESPVVRDASLDRLGPLLRLSADEDRVWVAGERGIAVRTGDSVTWEYFSVPQDLPAGPVTDVLGSGDDVWAATPAGAVRLRWR
jgi:hypothetical protein